MNLLYRFSLLLTFLAIVPVVLFIYYYMYYFDPVRTVVGCVVLVVIVRMNKSIQGG